MTISIESVKGNIIERTVKESDFVKGLCVMVVDHWVKVAVGILFLSHRVTH